MNLDSQPFLFVRTRRFELPHQLRHHPLKVACLPISPRAHFRIANIHAKTKKPIHFSPDRFVSVTCLGFCHWHPYGGTQDPPGLISRDAQPANHLISALVLNFQNLIYNRFL